MGDAPPEDVRENIRENLGELDHRNPVRLHQAYNLWRNIDNRLKEYGFEQDDAGRWSPPSHSEKRKEIQRKIHRERLKTWLSKYTDWIEKYEEDMLDYFADGSDIDPGEISPKLVQVPKRGKYRRLFRYAKYTWSLPIQKGWGRAASYLVMDESNEKLIGIFALTDPVFNLSERDNWVGWDSEQRENRLKNVLDAYALGAVPPYNTLLGGKLVASLACSNQVREDVQEKYSGKESLISGKEQTGEVVLLTTTSAWGKSSMLSRLQYRDRKMWDHIGYTKGYGHFHLDSGMADKVHDFLKKLDHPVLDKMGTGDGPSPKMRMMKGGLNLLDIDEEVMRHGIKRGFYAAPLARNFREFLTGEDSEIDYYDMSVEDIFSFFRERYLLDRAKRVDRWQNHSKEDVRVTDKLQELGIA